MPAIQLKPKGTVDNRGRIAISVLIRNQLDIASDDLMQEEVYQGAPALHKKPRVTVDSRGRVVLVRPILQKLGIQTGDELLQEAYGTDKVLLTMEDSPTKKPKQILLTVFRTHKSREKGGELND